MMFIILGLVFILIGILIGAFSSLRIGRLPGDILIKKENFTFYFPLTTSIILSVFLSLFLTIFLRFFRKN